jgi:2-haloacid dehalogenase
VFDIGNVLLDWNPRYLYRHVFDDPERMEWFLAEVCSPGWNLAQDGGRPWPEGEAEAIARHPAMVAEICLYRARWHETIAGPIKGSVALLEDLARTGVPLFAITNFAADTFAESVERHAFLRRFQGVVVSGRERLLKPDPAIYRRLCERYALDPAACVFIDDSAINCQGAESVGMVAVHFTTPASARTAVEHCLRSVAA